MDTYRGRVKRTMLLSREDDQDHKTRARKQRTGASKYSFVNRTIKLWYQLHAEALVTSKHEIEKCVLKTLKNVHFIMVNSTYSQVNRALIYVLEKLFTLNPSLILLPCRKNSNHHLYTG
jgi:hypothetical protein